MTRSHHLRSQDPCAASPTAGGAPDPVADVLDLFASRGDGHYGESIDQRRHALQSATLAVADWADDCLVAAALLHDIGHLLSGPDRGASVDGAVDDHHESIGARWLAPRFGTDVARVVALHVTAKRFRCTFDPDYRAALSSASIQTLVAQGGLLEDGAAARFAAHPGSDRALTLRGWDERAKDPDTGTPGLEAFVPILQRLRSAVTTPPRRGDSSDQSAG
jgi:predicted HD phosphohydrolase